jgi:hypothetical protein
MWAAVDYDDCLHVYREWWGVKEETEDEGLQMVAYEVARGILDREKGERERGIKIRNRYADPSIWHERPGFRAKEASGPTIHEDMSSEGVFFMKADNDRINGKMQVHKRLKLIENIDSETGEVIDEYPQLKVFNTCRGFWKILPSIYRDEKNVDDVDTKQPDDPYDCLRYLCMSRPVKPRKVERIPTGSFQHERARLIRAKKHALRHGTSVAAAYNRIR